VGHIRGEFEAKGEKMKRYLAKVQDLQTSFQKFCITKIPREDNEKADRLAQMASAENTKIVDDREHIRSLRQSSISDEASKLASIEEISGWRREIIDYLQNGTLPSEKRFAVQLKMKAGRFMIVNAMLYKRGFTLPLLKCVSLEEGNYIVWEIRRNLWKPLGSKGAST
jgi:hypothetical protein